MCSLPKALAIAMCSMVEIIGIVNKVVPIFLVNSIKLYVLLLNVVENGGGVKGGKPWPIVPKNHWQNIVNIMIDNHN